ncbi:lymphocyte-specific protein 1 isoform X4 [Scophthalmus maximus]|uniref:lymphocyte-specific protein 1 isoform X4 n=1 Tax=Scophthalmus maximus TaxID=52904 RepID=UPI001FA8E445|nr:lymphocyte-specific protein 1 isoform X4 [Scophthalmus maximus]
MSNALLRRNSSKQGLQNLMRLTAQRSIEDAEEVEREHRRRAREALEHTNSGSTLVESSPENGMPTEENMYNRDFKPSSSPSLEEDEGFSDWTQRRERQRQQHLQELSQGGEEDEEENTINKAASVKTVRASVTSSSRLQGLKQEETDRARMEAERRKEHEEEVGKRKEVKVSYTSKVFLHQQPKHSNSNGDATNEEVASHINSKTKRSTRAMEPEEAEAILETEQCLEKIRRGFQVKESQKLEQLKSRREDRHRVREEYEHQREEEEQQRLAKEEITERKESLNHLLKKSNSFKKTQPLILMSKIDDKLEQYAHAVEEAQAVKASMTDLPSSPEVISSKKNLFEAGEAWSQSPTKGATCKDVKPGGVMQKKNMWEVIGDASGRPRQRTNKGSATCKKYKFVVTGHGKYEKIPVDKENHW